MSAKRKTFRQTLERIEQIVREIEQGDVELEASVERYEEGMELIRQARSILASSEQKIRRLQAESDDEPELEDFEPGD